MRNLHLLLQTFSQARQASGTPQINGLETPHTQKVTRRAQGIAADLRRIGNMRHTLGLDGHPEFDALIARYPQTRPAGGRKIVAP